MISFHPYYLWNLPSDPLGNKVEFENFVSDCVKFAGTNGKDLLASETVWGAIDDARHVEVMRYTLGVLKEHGLGFIVHALHHSLVADLHLPEYGPVGPPGLCIHQSRWFAESRAPGIQRVLPRLRLGSRSRRRFSEC